MLEQFAKSHHGQKIYHMQQDGIAIADTQREMTTFQERVYTTAKAYWTEQEQKEAESNAPSTNKYV